MTWKNTGYHMVCCCCLVAKLCFSCDPMTCSRPGFFVHGIPQARILEWGAISSSRESSQPRDWTCISRIGRRILYHWSTWEAPPTWLHVYKFFPPVFCPTAPSHCLWLHESIGLNLHRESSVTGILVGTSTDGMTPGFSQTASSLRPRAQPCLISPFLSTLLEDCNEWTIN